MPEDLPQREAVRRALAAGEQCLSAGQIEAFAQQGALADASFQAHLAECPRCEAELALFRSFHSDSASKEEEQATDWIVHRLRQRPVAGFSPSVPASGPSRFQQWWTGVRWGSVALAMAGVLVAVGAAIHFRRSAAPGLDLPPDNGTVVLRSDSVPVVAPAGDQTEVPGALEWKPVAQAVYYEIQITEVDRHEVWRSTTRQTSVPLPEAVRKLVVPGKPLLWQVTARDASGAALGSSPQQRFRLVMERNPPARPQE